MMKSPSDQTDSSTLQGTAIQMNTERRISWQGQYQFSRPPHPSQFPGPDGQAAPRPPYFPEKQEIYSTPPNYASSPSADPNAWQGGPPIGGMDRYSQGQPSPAHSASSQYSIDPREGPNNGGSANGMSAAAAAAAAAMAAAAHSAKASAGYQKSQNAPLPPPNVIPKPMPMQQRSLPFHPNYANVQTGGPSPNVPPMPQDPGIQNHSSPYQPSPGQPMNRPMAGPQQYTQWGPQQPPPNSMDYRPTYQQGYDGHMQSAERTIYPDNMPHGPMSNASSHDSEESRPKSSARSSSQKISALFEPEEPSRREFVDRVLRYWEEKELPLKHAPMMGGRTLDLYVLYQHVKTKGFMQEVTRSKEWSEISSAMGLGNTSAAGFTLKKQYCKYLYGFECHFERGEPEPQEALGRVIEANRKKKQIAEQNQAKVAENSNNDMKPGEDPRVMPQRTYPVQHHDSPYRPTLPPPGGMPYHQQMPNMHPGYGAPGHNHSVPHLSHPASYEQQPGYPPMNVGWQQGGPHYQHHRPPPPGQPRYIYRSNGIPQNSPGHYLPQTNSLDHGQGPPPRPRFDQPLIPSRPLMQAMPAPPELKLQPQPNHTIPPPPSEAVTSTSSAENLKSTPDCENVQEQKVQDSVMTTATCQPTVAPETAQANPNLSGATSATTTPNEKQDVPAEQSTGVSSLTPAAFMPTETPISVGNKTPQDSQVASVSTPKPATSQPNAHRNTPNNAESVVQPKLEFMKSPELPKLNDCLASSYKPRPELGPGPQMNNHLRGPPPRLYPPSSSTMGPDSFEPPGPYHRPPDRPMVPGMYQVQHQYHQGYSPYRGVNPQAQPSDNPYYGQKRLHHSMEQYGPRNKIPRPDPNMYNMQYRDSYELQRRLIRAPPQRNDPAAMPHHFPPYTGGSMVQQAPPGMRHYPSTHPHQNYVHTPRHMLSPMPRSNSPSVGMNMQLSESQKPRPQLAPQADSAGKFLRGLVSAPNRPQTGHFPASGQTYSSSPYPIGSVESVVPSVTKLKEKTALDFGVIEAWQVILSLKSGLLAESSWALNALSVLLHDDRTVGQIMLSQLPGLLNTVIEHYRHCLQQLFGICDTPQLKKEDAADGQFTEESDATMAAEKLTSDILLKCKMSTNNLTMGGKQLKYLPAPSRLQNPYSKLPVKVVEGENRFPLLLDTLWDKEQNFPTSEIIPILSVNGNSTREPVTDMGISATLFDPETRTDKESLAELTFEDMLSIPSFVRCLAQNQIVSFDNDNNKKNGKDFSIFPEVENEQASQNRKVNKKEEQSDAKVKSKGTAVTQPESSAESKPVILQHKDTESKDASQDDNASHIQSCLERFIWSCDVALLEEEAAGFPGNSGFKLPSGINNSWRLITRGLESIFPKKTKNNEPEMVLRILCLSNLIRSLSCAIANHNELFMQPDFFKTISGTLLLGHKHRLRRIKSWRDLPKTDTNAESCEMTEKTEHLPRKGCLNNHSVASALSFRDFHESNEIDENRPLKEAFKHQLVKNAVMSRKNDTDTKTSNNSPPSPSLKSKETSGCEEFMKFQENGTNYVTEKQGAIFAPKTNIAFSSTVLNVNLITQDDDSIYHDPWWWECVKQIREDSLVTLANLSTSLNISLFPNDDAMPTIMDACLHWAVCSSADAQDPFPSTNPRTTVSSQSLGIEILTKLSMKEGNVDLILATRPYARLEKLFTKLTTMVGNRKDQTLREFSIILLSNLCNGEIAARAIALQTGAISNLLTFLEECEETGLNNQRMFPAGQESVNCGTVSYMMQRSALTLLQLAKLEENRPLFLKHHLRLLSLSMSSLLGRTVLPLISAVLFELSRESPNR